MLNWLLFSLQSLSEKLARKEKEYLQLEEMLATETTTKKNVQDGLREREQEVQELQSRVIGAEASLQKARADLQERSEEVAKLKIEMGELEVKHAELKVERKQLEQQREEKESHGAQQQTEISQVSHPHPLLHILLFTILEPKIGILMDTLQYPHMYIMSCCIVNICHRMILL